MIKATLTGQRLAALFLFGWVLVSAPVLSLFDVGHSWGGVPVLYLHVFGVWAALIGLMAWIIER